MITAYKTNKTSLLLESGTELTMSSSNSWLWQEVSCAHKVFSSEISVLHRHIHRAHTVCYYTQKLVLIRSHHRDLFVNCQWATWLSHRTVRVTEQRLIAWENVKHVNRLHEWIDLWCQHSSVWACINQVFQNHCKS